ncbi:hypothetical protein [Gymnodinialimonas sp.]
MHEIIRKIDIPQPPRTGVMKEREVFAKMEADQRAQRRRLRRDRWLTALRLKRRGRRT